MHRFTKVPDLFVPSSKDTFTIANLNFGVSSVEKNISTNGSNLVFYNQLSICIKHIMSVILQQSYYSIFFYFSLATSSAHLEDLAYLDEQQRHIPSRTSLRMPRQNSGIRSQQDHRGKCTHGAKHPEMQL